MLNLERWLRPLSETEPCGPNLEYDPDLIALERASQSKPERQYGATIVPATPPDWNTVRELAHSLLDRTRDLRVAVALAAAELHLSGYQGLGEVLALIHGWCHQFWPTLHPQLDPSDDNDPTLRLNLLGVLTSHDFLCDLRRVPLITHGGVWVSLRHLAVARGEIASNDTESLSQNEIDCAWKEVSVNKLLELRSCLDTSVKLLDEIGTEITTQMAVHHSHLRFHFYRCDREFSQLSHCLRAALSVVVQQLAARGVSTTAWEVADNPRKS